MKKIVLTLLTAFALTATLLPAQGRGGGQRGGGGGMQGGGQGQGPAMGQGQPRGQAGTQMGQGTMQRDRIRATDQQRDQLRTCDQPVTNSAPAPATWRSRPAAAASMPIRLASSAIKCVNISRPCSRSTNN